MYICIFQLSTTKEIPALLGPGGIVPIVVDNSSLPCPLAAAPIRAGIDHWVRLQQMGMSKIESPQCGR